MDHWVQPVNYKYPCTGNIVFILNTAMLTLLPSRLHVTLRFSTFFTYQFFLTLGNALYFGALAKQQHRQGDFYGTNMCPHSTENWEPHSKANVGLDSSKALQLFFFFLTRPLAFSPQYTEMHKCHAMGT